MQESRNGPVGASGSDDDSTMRFPASMIRRTGQWRKLTLAFCCVVLVPFAPAAWAQDPARSGRLYDELARMDRELFDAAFVSCDQAKFSSLFTDDAEFYHDRTGATYGESVKQLKSCPRDNGVRRTLVAGSLEVYPIKDFGAVQLGRHTFTREGEPGAEIARFVHLWRHSEGAWRLARVLSFDHRPVTDHAANSASDAQQVSSVMPEDAMQWSAPADTRRP